MCGRFVSARKRMELLEEFAATRDAVAADREPDYNVAPTKRIYTVLERDGGSAAGSAGDRAAKEAAAGEAAGAARPDAASPAGQPGNGSPERELRLVRWGLVPSWAKDTKVGSRLINARAETVAVKPSFRSAFARRRCLIPADGYYEWVTEGQAKQPFYIYRGDGGLLAFAGLYELWRNSEVPEDHDDAWYWSATIITTQATDEIGRIHDRTPMVIAPDDWADWLDPANKQKEHMLEVMRPAMAGPGGLTSRPVSTAVNSVRHNGPSLIEPLDETDPPA
jgi:putative SOS response-associated peptidase YedK